MGEIYVLDPLDVEDLLASALVGRIACSAPELTGTVRPYIVPLAYGYDGEAVYAFSSPGKKLEIMRAQPLVQFQADEATAADRWQSVIADGEFEELTSEAARQHAHDILFGGRDDIPPFDPDHVVYRIRLTSRSGRYEVPDGEQPRPARQDNR